MRELHTFEMLEFLSRHPDTADIVHQHESIFSPVAGIETWDQMAGDYSAYGISLPIPSRGLAVDDEAFGTVVIFPDVVGILHYSGDVPYEVAAEVRKPVYASDGAYLEMFSELLNRVGRGIEAATNPGDWFYLAAAGIAVYVLIGMRR